MRQIEFCCMTQRFLLLVAPLQNKKRCESSFATFFIYLHKLY
jgi:hypothetical protein